MLPNLTFVLGGAGSGKSDLAERIVVSHGLPMTYLATAQAFDDEMAAKIDAHKLSRGAGWRSIECPLDLSGAIAGLPAGGIALVDCATLWLSNHLLAGHDLAAERAGLLAALADAPCPLVVVSNEVGQGIVPENALARRFRAEQGRLNREIAALADPVIGVMAGLPFALKGQLPGALA